MSNEWMWQNQKGEDGRDSLQYHTLKVVKTWCAPQDHFYELTGNRELTCKHCGGIFNFVVGIHKYDSNTGKVSLMKAKG